MPHSKYLDDGLLELRIRGQREIRIFYCFHNNKAFLLHSFIKKTQKTSGKELSAAKTAMSNLQ
jgi:phage-related protein